MSLQCNRLVKCTVAGMIYINMCLVHAGIRLVTRMLLKQIMNFILRLLPFLVYGLHWQISPVSSAELGMNIIGVCVCVCRCVCVFVCAIIIIIAIYV